MATVDLQEKDGAVTFRVRVQPRASRDEAAGIHNGAIKLRITAPPVEGRANEAIRRLIARLVGVSQSAVEIVSGLSARDKVIRVQGVTATRIREALSL